MTPKTARVWVERLGTTTEDHVAIEEPLEIRLASTAPNGARHVQTAAITMRTPGDDEDLALGFLFTEGLLLHPSHVTALTTVPTRGFIEVTLAPGVPLDAKRLERHFYVSSSCGVCGKASLELVHARLPASPLADTQLPGSTLAQLPAALHAAQLAFATTGGLHAAALFTPTGHLTAIREDVGRHNAVDKVIASQWRHHQPLTESVLFLSGRASFELLQKAAMARIPIVAAVGAPSSLAVELAESTGITLAGFVRAGRWNVYSHSQRIV